MREQVLSGPRARDDHDRQKPQPRARGRRAMQDRVGGTQGQEAQRDITREHGEPRAHPGQQEGAAPPGIDTSYEEGEGEERQGEGGDVRHQAVRGQHEDGRGDQEKRGGKR
jgi:hypothetical protein